MKKKWMLVVLLLMIVGFAAISTALYINGTAIIQANDDDFHVYYSDAYVNGEQDLDIIVDDTTISFETTLSNIGDIYEVEYEVTNGSRNYDADLVMVCTGGNDYLKVNNDFDDESDLISQDSRMGLLTLELVKSYTGDDLEVSIDCEIKANAVEREGLVDSEGFVCEEGMPAIEFGQPYSLTQSLGDNLYLEIAFVFYEEGKATMFLNGSHESDYIFPMFDVQYCKNKIIMTDIYDDGINSDMELYVTDDGEIEDFVKGSAYDLPLDVDLSNTTVYLEVDSNMNIYDDGRISAIIPSTPEFKGNFVFEFYNLEPSSNTDITKHTWTENLFIIENGDFAEEYSFEVIPTVEYGGIASYGMITSSGFYILAFIFPAG